MCSATAIFVIAFAAQVCAQDHLVDEVADKLAGKLSARKYKQLVFQRADLENTSLGKSAHTGHVAMPSSLFSPMSTSRSRIGSAAAGVRAQSRQMMRKTPAKSSLPGAARSSPSRASVRVAAGPPVQEDSPAEGGLFGAIKNFQKSSQTKATTAEGTADEGGLFGAFQSLQKSLPQLQFEEGWDKKLGKIVEEEMYDFAFGRKEKRWSPDRRPKHLQGVSAGPGEDSRLSWGGAESKEMYKEMKENQIRMTIDEGRAKMKDQPLGSAAVSVFGETCKVDADEELQSGLDEACKLAQVPDGEARTISGAVELAEMLHGKYGHYHDLAVLRNVGQVGFNIYGPWLGQRSFPYTEEQYLQKLESITSLLNDLDQAWYIKNFLLSPIRPRNGLPSRPRSDTAVTVRLNLSPTWEESNQDIVDAWVMLKGMR